MNGTNYFLVCLNMILLGFWAGMMVGNTSWDGTVKWIVFPLWIVVLGILIVRNDPRR